MMTALGKWKVAAYLTAIFAAGMISGWVVATREARIKQPPPPHTPGSSQSQGGPRGKPTIYQVDLDPDQKTQIDNIMREYGKRWDELRLQQGNQMRQDSSNRNFKISALLRPEQIEQWERLRKERDASWRANSRGGNSNSPRNSVSGEKGEHGNQRPRNKRSDGTNADTARGVTINPALQSSNPPAPTR